MKNFRLFIIMIFAFSCSKDVEKISNSTLENDQESKEIKVFRSTADMAELAITDVDSLSRVSTTKSSEDKDIKVFPLILDGVESELYAVVNFTDSTTVITTEYVNYPVDIIAYNDEIMFENGANLENCPAALINSFKDINLSVQNFSKDESLVTTPIEPEEIVETKLIDGELGMPPGEPTETYTSGELTRSTYNSGALLSTSWFQSTPFNYTLVNGDLSNDDPIGCVTIAVAQVFKYHKHPRRFSSNGSYINYELMPNLADYGNTLTYTAPFLYELS